MRSRSSRSSLLRLMILSLVILDNMVWMANGSSHHRVTRKIHLPRAVGLSRKFTCEEPQARAFNLKDLIQSIQQKPGESASQPFYIVLKRCDSHSGCCQSPDKSCLPVLSSIYYEEIEIEIWSLETNRTRRQWIRVEQHGRCSCELTTASERHHSDQQEPNVVFV